MTPDGQCHLALDPKAAIRERQWRSADLASLKTREGQEAFAPISGGDRASRPWRGERRVA